MHHREAVAEYVKVTHIQHRLAQAEARLASIVRDLDPKAFEEYVRETQEFDAKQAAREEARA